MKVNRPGYTLFVDSINEDAGTLYVKQMLHLIDTFMASALRSRTGSILANVFSAELKQKRVTDTKNRLHFSVAKSMAYS